MSVYTTLERADIESLLSGYELGELDDFQGIAAGIENTNYYLDTSTGQYVLTLFESTPRDGLDFFLRLTEFLAINGLPTAKPMRGRTGELLTTVKGKPATVVSRLHGASVEEPNSDQRAAIGKILAQLHLCSQTFDMSRDDDRGLSWMQQTIEKLAGNLSSDDAELARTEFEIQSKEHAKVFEVGTTSRALSGVPTAVIHADLFRDNVLFDNDRVGGVIDFYYAHTGPMIYDLAVMLSDWCFSEFGVFDSSKAKEIIQAYTLVRPLKTAETELFRLDLRRAALRFWLSRAHDAHFPRRGEITQIKDPEFFKHVLLFARREDELLASLFE